MLRVVADDDARADSSFTWTPTAAAVKAAMTAGTYYWHVWESDGTNTVTNATPVTITVSEDYGERPSDPMQALGPVEVNMHSGNVVVSTASPSFTTVSGPVGLTYTYNSLKPPAVGFTGSYYS
jgi:hypothetical protein